MILLCINCLMEYTSLSITSNMVEITGGILMMINNTLMMVQLGFPTGVFGGL